MAREVRLDPRLASRRRRALPIAALLVSVALVAEYRWPTPPHVIPVICAVGLGLCAIAVSGPLPIYRCPACHLRLRDATYLAPDAHGARSIRYVCPQCEVEWETGWQSGGDYGA